MPLVLDLSRLLPGPLTGRMLGSLGFRVLRLLAPQGDLAEAAAPEMYQWLNADKDSERVDLKTEAGRERLLALVREADVLLESNLPGVMERLGVGPDVLRDDNPALTYVRMAGYRCPAEKMLPGHDLTYLAASGQLNALGDAWKQVQLADLCGAFWAVIAALEGMRKGGGFYEVYLGDAAGAVAYPQPTMLGGTAICYGTYECADGKVALAALEPSLWARFCEALDRPQWLAGAYSPATSANPIHRELCDLFRTRTCDEWDKWAVQNAISLRKVNPQVRATPMPPWSTR